MQRRDFLVDVFAVAALAALASPARADTADHRETLFEALRTAKTEAEGRAAENAIWRWWLDQAPTPEVRDAIDHGMKRRESYDFEAAEKAFDIAVRDAPSYAEGWNQRAFARFLRDNIEGALSDLERAVELDPDHFGAWSGMYHVLIRMGRPEVAVAALSRAVTIHPWLKERGMLPPDPDARRPPIKGKQQNL
ncbi:tetratricopeptide repeat protein [Hoeflea sp. YIM 152468]|uniref:tetratricopeptide repeat protein n=1 Tax=Hoeflea sp. YIM 152468 TaxID=3031759 RepID=UPI0023DBAC27|nr:tetratricopeptide repeat protein [Hoeflea sp. YIM 152468]MDF1607938.1 tetratricopeptide repeat protein [Hoeflea sp. YIM 152468]